VARPRRGVAGHAFRRAAVGGLWDRLGVTTPPPDGPRGDVLFPPPPPGPAHVVAQPAYAPMVPPPGGPQYPTQAGANGFAIASLALGIVFVVPFAPILAIVFGIVALVQIGRTGQRGRGMAISGIVLGSLVLVAGIAAIVWAITSMPQRGPDGSHVKSGLSSVDSLQPGDCFSGVKDGSLLTVTAHPCTSSHQAQLITTVPLDEGPFPGANQAGDLAEEACAPEVDLLVRPDVAEDLEPYILYPDSSQAWSADRTADCLLVAVDGEMTGSLLR